VAGRFLPRILSSLKVRLVLIVLALLILAMWVLAYQAVSVLRTDFEKTYSDQQFAAVSTLAANIDDAVRTRLDSLVTVANEFTPAMAASPEGAQAYLETTKVVYKLFNLGLYVLDRHGKAIAEKPTLGRVGAQFGAEEFFRGALATGQPAIGKARIGRFVKRPVVIFAAPIKNERGEVIGVLAGGNQLEGSEVFGRLGELDPARSGWYGVISLRDRHFVTSNDPAWVLRPIAAPGVNRMLDRFIAGEYGSGISANAFGVQMLMSGTDVPSAGWLVTAGIPVATAFAPINAMQRRIYLAAGLLTFLAAALLWIFVRRELAALEHSARLMRRMSGGHEELHEVPVEGSSEIRDLQTSFNQLVERIDIQRGNLERESARNYLFLRVATEGIHILDTEGNIIEASDSFCEMLGYSHGEMLGMNIGDWDVGVADADRRAKLATPREKPELIETRHRRRDGSIIDVEIRYIGFKLDGHLLCFASARDITELKRTRESQRIAAVAFESQEGMIVTDADRRILRVNQAFSEMTGYSAEEVVGKTPALLKSGRQDDVFYRRMWEDLATQGNWRGEIWNRKKSGEAYPEWLSITAVKDAKGTVTHYVGSFVDISERKIAEDKIRSLAYFDALTGLPNRRFLMERLGQALASARRHKHLGALLFLDLDHFKTLNDTEGHDVGDLLLTQVAERLRLNVREGDTVARLGGDEFVVMLEGLSEDEDQATGQTETVAAKIREAINQPYPLARRLHHGTTSIGVSLFSGRTDNVEEILKHADVALYQAKDSGRNAVRFFDPALQDAIRVRSEIEAELHRALAHGELRLHFQVQADGEGGIVGAEALLRWQHPEKGLQLPDSFVPLAEDSGLILPIGRWVLETACWQLKAWEHHPVAGSIKLAVNVSARQFHQPDFVAQVGSILVSSGANPKRLKLELTETIVLSNIDEAVATMHALKNLGVELALDDFGTGYSSLSYLKRLPFDQLKIDGSFIRDIAVDRDDAAIVEAIMAMSQTLGIDTIAEGVETEAQRQFLERNGCRRFQGYLFGRPLPLAEFEAALAGARTAPTNQT
jgi:diguanylate cyclase (GGDEF)-like protein/PAS domain S-box-containing protein